MEEIFKRIVIDNIITPYRISNTGRIYSYYTNRFLKPQILRSGYHTIELSVNKIKYKILVHRLVAMTFIPNPDNKPMVNHIDGVKTNNEVSNLEWCTNSENQLHAFRLGLNKSIGGEIHHFTKFDNKIINNILKDLSNGIKINDVAKKYNVTADYIYKILNKNCRKDISVKYNINRAIGREVKIVSNDVKNIIENIFENDVNATTDYVYSQIQLERNAKLSKFITDIRKKHRKKMVQRLSKG